MSRRRKIYILLAFAVLAVLAGNAWMIVRQYLSQESIRLRILDAAREQLGCRVDVGATEANVTGLLELNDVKLFLPGEELGDPAITCEKIVLDCAPSRLLSGKGGIDEIEVTRPTVRLTPDLLDFLSKLSKPEMEVKGQVFPRKIALRGGSLRFDGGMLYTGSPPIRLNQVEVTVEANSYSASRLDFRGSATQNTTGAMMISGTADLVTKSLTIKADIPRIDITGGFRNLLPPNLQKPWDDVNLKGQLGLMLNIAYSWAENKLTKQSIVATPINCSVMLKDFPLLVTRISGVAETDGTALRVQRAIARHRDGTIEVTRCHIDDKTIELEVLGRNVPLDQQMKDALPPEVVGIWDDFDIFRGEADVVYRLVVRRAKGQRDRAEHYVDMLVRDATANFHEFPYPVERLSGRVRVQSQRLDSAKPGQVEIDLRGTAGAGTLEIKGQVPLTPRKDWPGTDTGTGGTGVGSDEMRSDLTIIARGIAVDYRAKHAVPPDVRDVIEAFDPKGTVDVATALKLENDGMVRIKSKLVTVSLNGVAATMDFFPFPVQKLTGQIEWNGDSVKLMNVRGCAGKTQVEAAGEISLKKEPPRESYNLTVNVRDIDVDDRVLKPLPEEVYAVLRDINPEGTVDVIARLMLKPGEKLNVMPVAVVTDLRNARVKVKQFPYPVQNLSGRVEWKDGIVKIVDVRAAWGETVVDVSGEINTNEPDGDDLGTNVVVNARGIDLDERLRRALDQPMQATWDALSPRGKVNAICVLRPSAKAGNEVIQKLVIELDRCEASYSGFPYRLKGLTGKVVVKEQVAYLENITGYGGTSPVKLSGHIWTGNPDDPMELRAECDELFVQARDVPFDSYLKDAMPDDWQAVWEKLQPTGMCDADLRLSWLPGSSVWVDAGSSITGRGARLKGYRIPDAVYPVRLDDDFITFDEFRGTLYGGQVRGNMRFARKSDRFAGQLKLSNVDLKQFIDEQSLKWDIRGYLCGAVNLSGLTTDRKSLEGGAELQIRNGQLANINVVASMLIQLFSLKWPGSSAITDMEVVCRLKDGNVLFGNDPNDERGAIVLSGSGVPIVGDGTITLGGDMDLIFVTRSASKGFISSIFGWIPGVGWVVRQIDEKLLSAIRDMFIKVKVTGNVMDAEPKVTAQPLDVIVQSLKAFVKLVAGSPEAKKEAMEESTEPPPKK